MSDVRVDLDSPWKQILKAYFPEAIAFFYPDSHTDRLGHVLDLLYWN